MDIVKNLSNDLVKEKYRNCDAVKERYIVSYAIVVTIVHVCLLHILDVKHCLNSGNFSKRN